MKDLSGNKIFWKTIESHFSNKEMNSNKMLLKEKGELVSGEKQLASIMNKFLINTTKNLNLKEENGCFPDDIKLVEVSPVFKKNDDLDKENYRPVSSLFNVSKVFKIIMYKNHRKNHSTQHCLM